MSPKLIGSINFPKPRFEPWQDLDRFIFTAPFCCPIFAIEKVEK